MMTDATNEVLVRPVVVVLVVSEQQGQRCVMMQQRTKAHEASMLYGSWEFPQGKLRVGETLAQAAARELREESGLQLEQVLSPRIAPTTGMGVPLEQFDLSSAVLELLVGYVALPMQVTASGVPADTPEATGHRWVDAVFARQILEQNQVFPLNAPILRHFFQIDV